MKFLFKLIVIPILSIVAVPLILLILTYKDVSIPVEDFQGAEAVTLTEMISEEFDGFLASNDATSTLGLGFSQQEANGLLKSQFLGINPNYLDENASDDDQNYVLKEATFGYQGSWVRFKEDVVEIESGMHAFVPGGFTYKTALLITFRLTADTEEIVLKLEDLKVGSLPLAWMFGVADWGVEQFTGSSLKELIDGQLNGLATFDPKEREIRMEVQTLIKNQFADDPQSAALVNSLLQFVAENDLLDIGFEDEVFRASLALGKTKDATDPLMLAEADKINDDLDLQSILSSKATSLIFSTLTSSTPFIELDAFTLNRIFEYSMRDQLVSSGVIHQLVIFEDYQMTAYVPYVTMDEDFIVNIPLLIQDLNNPTHQFPTIIKIAATPEIVVTEEGSNLRIVLNELVAGEVSLSEEHIGNVLALLGEDNGLISEGAFVIENFDSQMDQAGLGLQSVAVVNNNLRLYVELNDTLLLDDIQDAVNDVLEAIVDNPEYSGELNDAVNDVLDSLVDPLADPEEAVENLLEVFEGLTDEEQQVVYADLLDAFEDSDLDLEDILGLLP